MIGTKMANKEFIISLAKVLIAGAWVDGNLQSEEINSLKDIIFSLPKITGKEWLELEIYMDSPVKDEERNQLIQQLISKITTSSDKKLIINSLSKLFAADNNTSQSEKTLLQQIETNIAQNSGIFSTFSNLIKNAISKQKNSCKNSILRENRLDDFIQNTIYYQLTNEQKQSKIPNDKLRKLCLMAGILGQVAYIDGEFSPEEQNTIGEILEHNCSLPKEEAQLIAQISQERTIRGLDQFRLTRNFFETTSRSERLKLLNYLFAIANSCEKTSHQEIEKIREIATLLKLTHQDFINAKLTIPREDRNGL